jgi:hypothetical protein
MLNGSSSRTLNLKTKNSMTITPKLASDLIDLSDLPGALATAVSELLDFAGLALTRAAQRENESAEYGACRLHLDGSAVVFRVAKTTPTKLGQFVTIWRRPRPGENITPLDSGDGVDLVIVRVADACRQGYFVFPQQALIKYGVMSCSGKGGKRAIRVYPPWCSPVASAALKTQQWQLRYFVSLDAEDGIARMRMRELLHR